MTINQLIKALKKAKKEYSGDVDVQVRSFGAASAENAEEILYNPMVFKKGLRGRSITVQKESLIINSSRYLDFLADEDS